MRLTTGDSAVQSDTLKTVHFTGLLTVVPAIAYAQSASPTFLEQNREAVAVLIFLYILPSLIAYWRKHPSKPAIILIDLLFGWTLIGWFWALIWACGKTTQPVMIVSDKSATGAAMKAHNAPAANSVASKSVSERIADLKAMLDSGVITEAEFALLKADALKSIS